MCLWKNKKINKKDNDEVQIFFNEIEFIRPDGL